LRRHLTHGADSPSSPEEPHRRERSLAIARIFLAASLYIAALFAPSPWPLAKHLAFAGYAVFSVAVLVVLRGSRRHVDTAAIVHAIDLLAVAGMTTLTGPGSPFVLAVLFPLTGAAHRWGFRATMATAAAGVVLLATPAALAAMGAITSSGVSQPGAVELLATRAALILITGVILGYVTQTERRIRTEADSIAAIVNRVELRSGLSKALALVCDAMVRIFDANRAILVVRDVASDRVWSWEGARLVAGGAKALQPTVLDTARQDTFLFAATATAWHAVRRPDDRLDVVPGRRRRPSRRDSSRPSVRFTR
jgi:hypothetical protein